MQRYGNMDNRTIELSNRKELKLLLINTNTRKAFPHNKNQQSARLVRIKK